MVDNKKLKYTFYICLGIIVIGCFLPYVTALGYSTNYVFYDGNVKDGIFIIGFAILALIFILKDKYLGALISQCASFGIFLLDFFDYKSKLNSFGTYVSSISKFGVGFYIVLVGVILSLVISIILFINKRKIKVINNIQSQPMNNTMNQVSMQNNVNINQFSNGYIQNSNNMINQSQNNTLNQNIVQPENNMYCQNCGAIREQNFVFCQNCGIKF